MDLDYTAGLSVKQQEALVAPYRPTPPPDSILTNILHDNFGLDDFRPAQLECIRAVISGRNCFVRMATGSGKSLLWQLPALVQSSPRNKNFLTVVICPTKSLIMDQMTKLCMMAPAFEAICFHGDQPKELNNFTLWLLGQHEILPHCLLITPELLKPCPVRNRLEAIYRAGLLARFVIDEADKFLSWGESFRNSYLILSDLHKDFPNVPILAMSGSITDPDMRASITRLGMDDPLVVSESLDRPKLYYEIRQKGSRRSIILDIIYLTSEGSGIVYCSYMKETTKLAADLRSKGIQARPYHANLPKAELKEALDSWKTGRTKVIVATTAFGMGIDKNNVRWVVHETMPSSVEGWFQESGRAGRDGLHAHCILYFRVEDYYKVKQLIGQSAPAAKLSSSFAPLHQLTSILLDHTLCRRQRLLRHFNEDYLQENCGACDVCNSGRAGSWSYQDAKVDALNALNLLAQLHKIKDNWTEQNLAAAICGERIDAFRQLGVTTLKGFGCQFALAPGINAKRNDVIAFLLMLIHKKILIEYSVVWSNERRHTYIKPGPQAQAVYDGSYPLIIPIPKQ